MAWASLILDGKRVKYCDESEKQAVRQEWWIMTPGTPVLEKKVKIYDTISSPDRVRQIVYNISK